MVLFKVETRKYKRVGEAKERVRMTILMGGVEVQAIETEPYIRTTGEVLNQTEEALNRLRLGLTNSGINSKVIREVV